MDSRADRGGSRALPLARLLAADLDSAWRAECSVAVVLTVAGLDEIVAEDDADADCDSNRAAMVTASGIGGIAFVDDARAILKRLYPNINAKLSVETKTCQG